MIALLLAAAAAAPVPSPTPSPIPRAEVHKLDDGTRIDLSLDGPLLGWSILRRGERRLVAVLVGPPDKKKEKPVCGVETVVPPAPRKDARLFAWEVSHPETLTALGGGLPVGLLEAVDLDGDGKDEAIVFGDEAIEEIALDTRAGTATARTLVTGRYAPADSAPEDAGALRAIGLGALTTFRRNAEGVVRPVGEVELPVGVSPSPSRVRVTTPGVDALGNGADGRPRFVTGMERIGVERVRTFVLDPDGPPDARTVEAWGRFPSRERALEHAIVRMDGRPVLVVLTTTADKLSLFGEKQLRVFALEPDRTRMGVAPLFALPTGINLWQAATPSVIDLDGDGHEDLVLAYWKGLKDSIAALEVHKRGADGSFGKGGTLDFDVTDGDRGFIDFGHDLDGDGHPDLVLRSEAALLVYPGTPKDRAVSRPVEKTPSRSVTLPGDLAHSAATALEFGPEGMSVEHIRQGSGTPIFVDLDGDGRVEAVFAGGGEGPGRVVIVRFR